MGKTLFYGRNQCRTTKAPLNNTKGSEINQKNLLYGSIDYAKAWKLNLYQEPITKDHIDNENENYLKAGDIIWIVLSQKKFYLSCERFNDPFIDLMIQQKQDLERQKMNELQQIFQVSQEKQIENLNKELFENYNTQFQSIKNSIDSDMMLFYELSNNGLFKIEPINIFEGGELHWGEKYRIKHLISGKYLKCEKKIGIFNNNNENQIIYELGLTNILDSQTLFKFVPIENLQNKYMSKSNIHKDAYFRLQYQDQENILWLGFQEEFNDQNLEQEQNNKPIFEKKLRDMNIFRFRKSEYQDIWETHFLLSAIPLFIQLSLNIVNVTMKEFELKQQDQKFIYFEFNFDKVVNTIKNLQEFITNKIICNISMKHEYNYPAQDRQNKFREQGLLGLFCWFLIKVFPQKEEFQILDLKADESLLQDEQDQELQQNIKRKEKIYRQCVSHIKKRYKISYDIYNLIKLSCYKNNINQEYFFQFAHNFAHHIGYGKFVTESFEFCFKGNFNILQSLHQFEFQKDKVDQVGPESSSNNTFGHEVSTESFFITLIKRFRRMEPYTKNDILSLLASFCILEDSTIYINQEKIFQSFVDNRTIIFTQLLKIREENDEIFKIQMRKKNPKTEEYEIVSRLLETFDKRNIQNQKKNITNKIIGDYFLSQIDLYCNMCANRNYTCGKAFANIFSAKTLQKYINSSQISLDLRARFCRLQRNIYIDKEPRLKIQKPNLVRIFKPQNDNNDQKKILNILFDPILIKMSKNPDCRVGKEKEEYIQMNKKIFEKYNDKNREDDIYIKFIQNNDAEDKEFLDDIKIFIKKQLKQCFQEIMKFESMKLVKQFVECDYSSNQDIYNKIFNNFTYEIIQSFHIMLKFGLFTDYSGNNSRNIFNDIVTYLSFILEFDIDYASELIKNGSRGKEQQKIPPLKRSKYQLIFIIILFVQNQQLQGYIANNEKQTKEQLNNNTDLINTLKVFSAVGGQGLNVLKGLTNLVVKEDEEEDQTEDIIKKIDIDSQNEKSTSFLKTYQSLLKLLQKYTNKTYKKKEIKISKDLEALIKIEICKIYEYLMDWREDFFINNIMKYFTEKFYNKYQILLEKPQKNQELEYQKLEKELNQELQESLPENMFSVGEPIFKNQAFRKFKQFGYEKNNTKDEPEVNNIDDIIKRPFVESLIIGFYFAIDSDLQNSLMNLIYRCYNQKSKFLKNLNKINLVKSGQSDSAYQKMSKLISKLKALISYSQSWLQIIEQNNYNEKAEENLDITLQKLSKLHEIFVDSEDNQEQFEVSQKIFKHLEGHIVLFQFIEQGVSILELNANYFQEYHTDCQYSYKKDFTNKVIEVFKKCHFILIQFCKKNRKIQKNIFKSYEKLLLNQSYINIGQIDLIKEIFKENIELSYQADAYFKYIKKIIKIHGKYPQLLDLFQIQIQNSMKSDNNEIQKYVIDNMFDPKFIQYINVNKIKLLKVLKFINKYSHFTQIIDVMMMNKYYLFKMIRNNMINYISHLKPQEIKVLIRPQILNLQQKKETYKQMILIKMKKLKKLSLIYKKQQNFIKEIQTMNKLKMKNIQQNIFKLQLMLQNSNNQELHLYIKLIKIQELKYQYKSKLKTKKYSFVIKEFINKIQSNIICIKSQIINLFIKQLNQKYIYILLKDLVQKQQQANNFILNNDDEYEDKLPEQQNFNNQFSISNVVKKSQDSNSKQKKMINKFKIYLMINYLKQNKQKEILFIQNYGHYQKGSLNNHRKKILKKTKQNKKSELNEMIKEERRRFCNCITEFEKFVEKPKEAAEDLLICKEDIIKKLLMFIQYWRQLGASKGSVIFTLKSLRHIVVKKGPQELADQDKSKEQEQKKFRQNVMNGLNTTRICITLIMNESSQDKIYLYYIFRLLISLLDDGNQNVQETVYNFFIHNSESEKFFKQLYYIMNDEINYIAKYKGEKTSIGSGKGSGKKPLIENVLRLLQLFCEGHNQKLQDYLRFQKSSKINYDLISQIVKLLVSIKISNETYGAVKQCFDTLTEVVQGPCKENQLTIIQSKFLDYALDLLKEENVYAQGVDNIVEEIQDEEEVEQIKNSQLQQKGRQSGQFVQKKSDQEPLLNGQQKIAKEQQEVYDFVKEFTTEQKKEQQNFIMGGIIGDLTNLTSSLINAGLGAVVAVGQKALELGQDSEDDQYKVLNQLKQRQEIQMLRRETFKFFCDNTIHIEMLRGDQLTILYFPKLPYCHLPKENKELFHENVDYNSDKGKLRTLIEESEYFIKVMEHEEKCKKLFKKSFITGLIAENKGLWENLAFTCNCIINILILASYGVLKGERELLIIKATTPNGIDIDYYKSLLQTSRIQDPRLFQVDRFDWTLNLIQAFGLTNLVFSSLVIVLFFVKKAPLLLEDMWRNWYSKNQGLTQKLIYIIPLLLQSLKTCLTDFDFVYYTCYISFCIIGLAVHPFFFGFLIVDFMRIKLLKNVVKAVYIPRVDLALTFMVFVLIQYYFTIISYILLYDQYLDHGGSCTILWKCFLYTFNWTFKETGSIGGLLIDPDIKNKVLQPIISVDDNGNIQVEEIVNKQFLGRFFYDNLFIFILVILLINMVAGIIIDNFSALKDETQSKESSLERKCFVCGIDRELIEKSYDDVQDGFLQHLKRDHYMWNYVYFKAYLNMKDSKELTGNESYVKEQLKTLDVSWFPVKRSLNIIDEDMKNELARKEQIDKYEHIFIYLIQTKQWFHDVKAETLTNLNYREYIFSSESNIFVDFFTPWCMYCRQMANEINLLFDHYQKENSRKDVRIVKVNCDDEVEVCRYFKVSSYPTILLFKKGQSEQPINFESYRLFLYLMQFIEDNIEPENKKFYNPFQQNQKNKLM
ncbi:MIR domain protein [Ichthyophthirius multifiliis]|uniref:MIR domain protein n=1 Tax=Ichthyophthirius multifiliis TaxID=5932 RepID=G0QUB0_ICHMU|nr:MIR domain protein [Ichthyophthirius multifiliis]EGR31182.1 MIR domain protein [Ichthyophthirius multifiliis]|eukprot:XP_004034668.1 MIR domain protein [Ichthyophthirius multifiliis]